MAKFTILTEVRGILIPFTSLVLITSGMKLKGMMLQHTLMIVPSMPHVLLGRRSKLKIWQIAMIAKKCLIKILSGLILK